MITLFLDARYADYIKSSASIYMYGLFPRPELVCCIIDISLNNLPVFPSNCVDFAQRCHRIASFSRLVDEKTFCVI